MIRKFDQALIFKGTKSEKIVPAETLTCIRKKVQEGISNEMIFSDKVKMYIPIDLTRDVFCPECQKPLLTVTQTYIRTRQKQNHENDCSYTFDEIPKRILNTFLENEDNKQKIINKINELAINLNNANNEDIIHNKTKEEIQKISKINKDLLIDYKYDEKTTRYSLPQQKLVHNFNPREPINNFRIYYGQVYLTQSKLQESKNLFSVKIKYKNKYETICSLSISSKNEFFKDKIKTIKDNLNKTINMAIFSKINQNKNGYYTIPVINTQYLVIN